MSSPVDFVCTCEGDLERVSAVFIQMLKNPSKIDKDRSYVIRVPNELWATLFVDIYTDDIENYCLDEEAEANVMQITFQVQESILEKEEWKKLSEMSNEELLDALEDLMDDLEDEEDDDDA